MDLLYQMVLTCEKSTPVGFGTSQLASAVDLLWMRYTDDI
jgi:hypothetical protein